LATGIVSDIKNFVSSAVDNIIGGSAQTNAKPK
jgi:hypothetical protein